VKNKYDSIKRQCIFFLLFALSPLMFSEEEIPNDAGRVVAAQLAAPLWELNYNLAAKVVVDNFTFLSSDVVVLYIDPKMSLIFYNHKKTKYLKKAKDERYDQVSTELVDVFIQKDSGAILSDLVQKRKVQKQGYKIIKDSLFDVGYLYLYKKTKRNFLKDIFTQPGQI
jgi:hypothetical protein